MEETQNIEKKSLKILNGKSPDWNELAKDCVCFANSRGGVIYIGIEDNADAPPPAQKIEPTLPEKVIKAISSRTINTTVTASIKCTANGAEYMELTVLRSEHTIASTTDGKYYIRVSDECRPVPPDEMARLAADKNAFIWEVQITNKIPRTKIDESKKNEFINDIKTSTKVSQFVKNKTDDEIMDYYFLSKDAYLTNLGALWIGQRHDRATILFAPAIQVIRYNERDEKVWKISLDDYSYNPKEMLLQILTDIPDWQESNEISDGMFRKDIPLIPIEVVRELVANALVHKTYTTRGDIFINLFPDKLEIHSPGRLPYGVTPQNILSQSVRRNEHLSKVFYDLNLMEKEGSGFDLVYELLLKSGKPLPCVVEGDDRVVVTVKKQVISKNVVQLMDRASLEYQLRQKEIIALGLIAQYSSLTSLELSPILNQKDETGLKHWLGRLIELGLVQARGKTKGTEYFVNPDYLRRLNFKGRTDLKKIEPHRLQELIYQDLIVYPDSRISDIHIRIGVEIYKRKVKLELAKMVESGKVSKKGEKRWTSYSIDKIMAK